MNIDALQGVVSWKIFEQQVLDEISVRRITELSVAKRFEGRYHGGESL